MRRECLRLCEYVSADLQPSITRGLFFYRIIDLRVAINLVFHSSGKFAELNERTLGETVNVQSRVCSADILADLGATGKRCR